MSLTCAAPTTVPTSAGSRYYLPSFRTSSQAGLRSTIAAPGARRGQPNFPSRTLPPSGHDHLDLLRFAALCSFLPTVPFSQHSSTYADPRIAILGHDFDSGVIRLEPPKRRFTTFFDRFIRRRQREALARNDIVRLPRCRKDDSSGAHSHESRARLAVRSDHQRVSRTGSVARSSSEQVASSSVEQVLVLIEDMPCMYIADALSSLLV